MKKVFIILAILILFIFLLFIFFFKEEKIRIDHIFLITIDTLRADHLSCYGYPRKTSSFLDSLAEKGVLFEKAISQSATTCPSHASIFTGLYPFQHRVLSNAYVLDDSYTTLAEILREKGLKVASIRHPMPYDKNLTMQISAIPIISQPTAFSRGRTVVVPQTMTSVPV